MLSVQSRIMSYAHRRSNALSGVSAVVNTSIVNPELILKKAK